MSLKEMFGDMTYYPGSKTKRREPAAVLVSDEPSDWDAHPQIKLVRGQEMELFTVGALAMALGKSVDTIRKWERKGYIPGAPYRLKTEGGGRRLYSRALIESAIDEFDKRGLLGKARVEWDEHEDLSIALLERWRRIKAAESGGQEISTPEPIRKEG